MAEKKDNLPSSNEADLSVPHQEAYTAYIDAKYTAQIKEGSQLRPDETPETFLARMLELYPDKDQQAYINGLYSVTPAAIYAPFALQGLAENKSLDPKILAMYPPELNQHICGKGLSDKSLWKLRLNPSVAVGIIGASFHAAFSIKRYGENKVRDTRRMVEEIALGKRKLEGATLSSQLKVSVNQLVINATAKTVGVEIVEQAIRAEIEKLITTDSLQLFTDSTAKVFERISHYVGNDFKVIDLLADLMFPAQLALNNMNIHPDVGKGFEEVFDRTIRKPLVTPQQ